MDTQSSPSCVLTGQSKDGEEPTTAWDPSFLRPHLCHMGAGPSCILQPPPRAPTPPSFLATEISRTGIGPAFGFGAGTSWMWGFQASESAPDKGKTNEI